MMAAPTRSTAGHGSGVGGTLKYLAPEVHMGHKATRRSESFCFAISAWVLLAGKQPYEDQPFITRADENAFVAAVTRERDPLRPDLERAAR